MSIQTRRGGGRSKAHGERLLRHRHGHRRSPGKVDPSWTKAGACSDPCLEWKMARRGHILVAVAPMGTSQSCPDCGHRCPENRKTQAAFKCIGGGRVGHADQIAAINIREAGHALLACQARGARCLRQQEPAEGQRCARKPTAPKSGIPAVEGREEVKQVRAECAASIRRKKIRSRLGLIHVLMR
jgi:hypothetical protein